MKYGYILRRIAILVATLYTVITITFILIRLSPYNPYAYFLSQEQSMGIASPSQLAALSQYYYNLIPNQPIYVQYFEYLSSIMRGNFGHSLIYPQMTVANIIATRLPWTLYIVITSTVISFLIGTYAGQRLGYKRGGKVDGGVVTFFTVLHSIPIYGVGLILLFFISLKAGLLPSAGAYAVGITPGLNLAFIVSVIKHSILPISTFILGSVGGWTLGMRANTISVLGEDYVNAAELRGIPSSRIASRYVGRNAILPQFTSLVISIGFAFGGSVFVEQIFTYPGIGQMLVSSVGDGDYPVIMGITIIIIAAVLVSVLVADLTYQLLDPRVRK